MALDDLMLRAYDRKKYNCLSFAADVWLELTGKDDLRKASSFFPQGEGQKAKSVFRRIDKPVSPCLALFKSKREHHIGVWHEGRVLHLSDNGAVYQFLDVIMLSFDSVRFYDAKYA